MLDFLHHHKLRRFICRQWRAELYLSFSLSLSLSALSYGYVCVYVVWISAFIHVKIFLTWRYIFTWEEWGHWSLQCYRRGKGYVRRTHGEYWRRIWMVNVRDQEGVRSSAWACTATLHVCVHIHIYISVIYLALSLSFSLPFSGLLAHTGGEGEEEANKGRKSFFLTLCFPVVQSNMNVYPIKFLLLEL